MDQEGSEADTSTAPTAYSHARVGGMIGVGFDISWKEKLFERVPDDKPSGYLAADACVMTYMSMETNPLNKDLSSVKEPSQTRRKDPPPTSYNLALTNTPIDVMQDLYPGDFVVLLRPTEEAIMEDVVCVLVASPVAGVKGRPTVRIV